MASKAKRIVVAGDVRIDELDYEIPPAAPDGLRWERSPQARTVCLPGDALLLAHFLREVAGDAVITYSLPAEELARANAVHAKASLERFGGAKPSAGHDLAYSTLRWVCRSCRSKQRALSNCRG